MSCMLTKVMVNNSLIDNIGAGEVSVASRAGTNRRREFDSVRALKAVTKREPRCHNGISPNSRFVPSWLIFFKKSLPRGDSLTQNSKLKTQNSKLFAFGE